MTFRIQVDVLDCLGCGNCADICPGNPKKGGKALIGRTTSLMNAGSLLTRTMLPLTVVVNTRLWLLILLGLTFRMTQKLKTTILHSST